jgi:hypothetical protein
MHPAGAGLFHSEEIQAKKKATQLGSFLNSSLWQVAQGLW